MKLNIPGHISHYYELERGPLRSVTEQDKESAREIIRSITAKNEGFSNNRPPQYIDWRIDVENWLRNGFIEQGGKPKRQTPHYFILGDCEWMLSWYKNGAVFKKELKDFDPNQVTFTYPDSMVSFQLYQYYIKKNNPYFQESDHREYHGKVFLLPELESVVAQYGLPKEESKEGKPTSHEIYIEVQIWDEIKLP